MRGTARIAVSGVGESGGRQRGETPVAEFYGSPTKVAVTKRWPIKAPWVGR